VTNTSLPAPFAIGEPGRAAAETPDGPPPAVIGPSDIAVSAATLPGVRILAASVRGVQHRAEHTVRQDAFALAQAGGTHAIAVVCDGVGSFDRSDHAAALVSRQLAQYGAACMPWPEAFVAANEQLAKVAAEWEAVGFGAMATTAVAASVSRVDGWWQGEVAWVGDSSLCHLDDEGTWGSITSGGDREDGQVFHSSSVRPMPTLDGACRCDPFRIQGGALFAMSDGVGNPLAWSAEVRATLARWWARPPDPLTFAAQVAFARRSHIDDRTVIGIWADEGGGTCGSTVPASGP
jgi:Protein phosphatase 2C